MRAAVGDWIMPWPGEKVMGEVVAVAVSGEQLLCRTRDGQVFAVHPDCLIDAGQVLSAESVAGLLTHGAGHTTVAANVSEALPALRIVR